jgi:hypothetical protein
MVKILIKLTENWCHAEQKRCGIELETTCKYEKLM